MGMFWAMVLKPFFLLGYCVFAAFIIALVKLLPDSKIKRLLLRRW